VQAREISNFGGKNAKFKICTVFIKLLNAASKLNNRPQFHLRSCGKIIADRRPTSAASSSMYSSRVVLSTADNGHPVG
jgi:hypothetical protein